MTRFAGFRLPALVGIRIQDLVRIFLKLLKIILMTGGTGLSAGIIGRCHLFVCSGGGRLRISAGVYRTPYSNQGHGR